MKLKTGVLALLSVSTVPEINANVFKKTEAVAEKKYEEGAHYYCDKTQAEEFKNQYNQFLQK